ncbi:MAG: ammonium transporter [Leptolyngbya sp. UWPOB_LEPTO1]|uniref:ammonium transporter n=1 Tax=Leptolyngbya sp. UWPOB_LEPTO1 TaxID=2815653 RepID=UPI001AD186EA|nr:ammonium transporter [Leptolyngbya sp. UWPOB_LEPTO1]MBN8561326.1 ammonium transporter [Leptolyngbya sp. UWPOB_LEPTO1]
MVLRASLKQKSQVRKRKPALLKSWEALLRTVSKLSLSWQMSIPITVAIVGLWSYAAVAQTPPTVESVATATADLKVGLDTMWVMIAGCLVFFMNAGFCMLETGMCRQKNAVNVLAKNLIVFALSTVAFWAIGFGLMFSNGNGWIGASGGFFLTGTDSSPVTGDAYQGIFKAISWAGVPLAAKFFFQLVFAGTAATIVSGAVAERIKFIDFLLFSLLLVGIAYPITGHWIWGGGWLATLGFYDFAGSTVVHAVGGWAALMGASFLGARIGKYNADGSANAIPPHNLSIATLGALILWLGWFGFNPGSTMSVGNGSLIAHIALTTNTGGAFGAIAATVVAWAILGKPDLTMTINGLLAGLVAVTAPCAWISVPSSAIIGAIGGILVVFAVGFFDKLKIDDPVGAIAVHLVNGVWGTLALGLFSQADAFGATPAPKAGLLFGGGIEQFWYQLVGVLSVGGFTVLISSIFWILLKSTLGIRVTSEEELEGLDISEHGMEAYAGFAKESAFGSSSSYPSSSSESTKY